MQELLSLKRRSNRILLSVRLLFALALLAAPLSTLAGTFTASLDRYSVIVGESVTLKLTFENAKPQEISGLPPRIDGLQVVSGVSQSFNSSSGPNGSTTVQSYAVALMPTRAGEFVIPPFNARVGGQTLTTQPLKLKVAQDDAAAPPSEFGNSRLFLRLEPSKRELFVGEVLTLELRLYIRSDVRRVGNIDTPLAGDGFVFSKPAAGGQMQRVVGGNSFTVVPLYIAMTPVKTGTFTLSLTNGSLVVNPRDQFDAFGFFGPEPQRFPLTLPPETFNVLPLPAADVPPAFSGAVGRYTLTASAGPTNVAAGDPITVKIQIAGEGQLDALQLPDQPGWQEFKTYPPTSKVEPGDQLGVQGAKTFEQIVVPQNTTITALPPISFSYFDPEQKSYRTLTHAAIPLVVRPGGSTPAPTVAATRANDNTPPASRDIVPIKQRAGTLARIAPPLVKQPWFLALQGVPLLAFAGAFIWRKRSDSLANNPRLRRQRQVARTVREGLNELRASAAANNSDAFFATVFRLLQEQLGERLDVPASAITEAVIDERLRPRGVAESTLAGLHELFQTCNLARYAPIKSSQELTAMIPKVETSLRQLQEVKA